ncbi:Peroxidase 12 [Triticum urartu]|uniref:peroxidase n=1 Tax=Triticum urartu TaxID=4572 RepID=M8A6N6_TRIUA|nr:Peroxidase 12 [Triticum urartu]
MASSSPSAARALLVLAAAALVLSYVSAAAGAGDSPPLAKGLSFDFYSAKCPQAEAIVFAFLKDAIRKDVGLAAALLRIHFHDCFVQGCDGSVLLDKTNGVDSEKVPVLLSFLAKIGLDADDLVALSGAHTLGIAHCGSFEERLFPKEDTTMNKWFAGHLKLTCPRLKVDNSTANDIRTPDVFDNKYYVDLGLFTSDQDLHTDAGTKPVVTRFAVDQAAFFDQFVKSMVKMGQINVLTGNQGQIRTDCSVPNAARSAGDELPWSVVEAAESFVL